MNKNISAFDRIDELETQLKRIKTPKQLTWSKPFELLGGNIRWTARINDVVFSITKRANRGGYALGAELDDGKQNKCRTFAEAQKRMEALRKAIIRTAEEEK